MSAEDLDKRAKKKARTDALYFGYTNQSNPFNDNQLREQFVWSKNDDGQQEQTKKERRKQQESVVAQINAVKERRKERDAEKAEFERLKLEQERLEQQDEAAEFFEKEKKFHQMQVYKRTLVRVSDERTHNVDIMTRNIVVLEALKETEGEITGVHSQKSDLLKYFTSSDIETRTVADIISYCCQDEESDTVKELNEILEGLETFVEAERDPTWKQYWADAATVTSNRLSKEKDGTEPTRGIHECVREDVLSQLDGKDPEQLEALRNQMLATVHGVDMEFDEAIYRLITLRQAQQRLATTHAQVTRMLHDIAAKMKDVERPASLVSSTSTEADEGPSEAEKKLFAEVQARPLEEGEENMAANNEVSVAGDQSNKLTTTTTLVNGVPVTVTTGGNDNNSGSSSSSSRPPATDDQEEDEKRPPGWGYKYRSRKPQYLNKVKAGYDWNKYNRAHYDRDNPPPKTVQGYKFNIFYPDLMDNSVTPKYVVEAADTQDFCIIRFTAGPPYEDLAFKIVNKEWEIGRRAGYKSTFQRGVLQLHFNFKRSFYRR